MALSVKTYLGQLLGFIGAVSGITDKVLTRYYYGRLPQNSLYPALSFNIISLVTLDTKDGVSEYDYLRVQFTSYAARAADAEDLYDAIRTGFDRFTDEAGTVKFHETFFKGRQPLEQDFDTKIYYIHTDYEFHIK